MISLQKLFGKTDVFYDLLERSAKEAQNSVHLLKNLLSKPAGSQSLDSLKDAVFLVALDGEVVRYWNRGAEALYGWRAADVLGHSSDLLHTRFLGPVTPEQVRAALTERRCWRGEVHQRHRDGRELLLEASLSYLRDASGEPAGIITICREISATCELLQSTFEHTPDALSIFDLDGRIVRSNAAAARRLGRPLRELLGRRAEELVPEVVGAQHTATLQRARATGEPQTTEFAMAGTTGWHTFELRYVPLQGPQGQPAHILSITRDLSERAAAADAAEQDFINRSKGGVPDDIPEIALSGAPLGIAALLKAAGLAPSTSEASRLIDGGGVRVDSSVVSDKALKLAAGRYVVQVGKRKFARVTLA